MNLISLIKLSIAYFNLLYHIFRKIYSLISKKHQSIPSDVR
ncbi:pseudouridine synthase [Streptococcus pseudopneumoniae]|uniref:Pseudouridine synthase n=1 Tax=Streptococcus pseudopneumoniae TaxID=257758 RepID=A0ABX9PAG5_9STRE|nr:pseudouridine synthase [Streptococcus pseudopneumoniae]RJY11002.1 pseudouridine synthase [Streptococcus pseudopneumoniae]